METGIYELPCPDGQVQRVALAKWNSWEALELLRPTPATDALHRFGDIYEKYLIPACPILFGSLVLFRLPPALQGLVPMPEHTVDPLTAAAELLKKDVSVLGGKVIFRSKQAKQLWKGLKKEKSLRIVRGKLPTTQFIPVSDTCGYLSQALPEARLRVNGSFFIMDPFDCATVHDHVGTYLGLYAKNGVVVNPPMYDREALLVKKDGSVTVRPVSLQELKLEIAGQKYAIGENATVYTRPSRLRTPGGKGKRLVIVGDRVAAVYHGGSVAIPASGFVLCTGEECAAVSGDRVIYRGMEDVTFGIQVGNSILRDGVPTEGFLSKFYNIRHLEPVPYPPSLYPMDFQNARAARIALGADEAGRPMLLWVEGAAKQGHIPGEDSPGASLSDMASICQALGMHNAVNLDGGGSAQMLLGRTRPLQISDRHPETERPIPMALMVR